MRVRSGSLLTAMVTRQADMTIHVNIVWERGNGTVTGRKVDRQPDWRNTLYHRCSRSLVFLSSFSPTFMPRINYPRYFRVVHQLLVICGTDSSLPWHTVGQTRLSEVSEYLQKLLLLQARIGKEELQTLARYDSLDEDLALVLRAVHNLQDQPSSDRRSTAAHEDGSGGWSEENLSRVWGQSTLHTGVHLGEALL